MKGRLEKDYIYIEIYALLGFSTSSLPPLDWPLPIQYGQCELKIEVQPKTHHRAHYETEGSRGAVKASTGGHPVVKVRGANMCLFCEPHFPLP